MSVPEEKLRLVYFNARTPDGTIYETYRMPHSREEEIEEWKDWILQFRADGFAGCSIELRELSPLVKDFLTNEWGSVIDVYLVMRLSAVEALWELGTLIGVDTEGERVYSDSIVSRVEKYIDEHGEPW